MKRIPTPTIIKFITFRSIVRNIVNLFRPSRWWWVGTAIFWIARALSLRVLLRWGVQFELADIVGFAWDIPLVIGFFGLGRLTRLTVYWRKTTVTRLYAFGYVTVLVLLATAPLFTRAADMYYGSLAGGHFSFDAFLYITPKNVTLLFDGHSNDLIAGFLASVGIFTLALWRDGRGFQKTSTYEKLPGINLFLGMVCGSFLALAPSFAVGLSAGDEQSYFLVPEARFIREWLFWKGILTQSDTSALRLLPSLRKRFVALGLMPEQPLWKDYPLSKAQLDTTPFPFPKSATDSAGPPNIVLILVEQLDREFIYAFSGELRRLMPELSAIARRATMVTEYRSVCQPTIHALMATLCSIHGAAPFRALNKGRGSEALERTPLRCLPDILRDRGYRTVYIQGGNNAFAGTDGFLRAHGFSEMFDDTDIEKRFPDREQTHWGIHDDALIEFSKAKIGELETRRAKDGRPYFLLVQTIDMHAPGLPGPHCVQPKVLENVSLDEDSKTMLRTIHCTDRALGDLGRYILDDPNRSQSTIWAITGDHPTNPLKFLKKLRYTKGPPYTGWSGPLPLILHDPTHRLPPRVPVLSGHIDLAPTLLHILGITDVPNAMAGYSIFGERPKRPLMIGRMAPIKVAIHRPAVTKSFTTNRVNSLCRKRRPLIEGDPQALTACELRFWLRWQNALWKYKRVFPEKQN